MVNFYSSFWLSFECLRRLFSDSGESFCPSVCPCSDGLKISFCLETSCSIVLFQTLPSSNDTKNLKKPSSLKKKILEKWTECARKQLDKVHTADEVFLIQ